MSIDRVPPVLLAIDVTAIEGQTVLALRGELDLSTQPRFMAALAGLDDGVARVVLDLSDLTFIDCRNVGIIHRAQVLAALRGTEFVVRSANPDIARVMELTGLSPTGVGDGPRPVAAPQPLGGSTTPALRPDVPDLAMPAAGV